MVRENKKIDSNVKCLIGNILYYIKISIVINNVFYSNETYSAFFLQQF